MGVDLRGDPAAALLEVLDPEQNNTFQDHYLDLPFDLSQVMFLATANNRDGIPPALHDRMEVIEVPGYTRSDKLGIAREFLVPKQLSAHGLTDERLEFTGEGIACIVDHYTREAGVRGLEREIAAVCRATAVKLAEGRDVREIVSPEHVEAVLGPHKHRPENAEQKLAPGVATGLAWTPGGGEILFIEASKMPGKGNIVLTGNMRNVMQESATTAVSFVRSKAALLHLDPEWLKSIDLHLHIPQHGTPKDGPSAGVTMFTAVASLLLECPVRADVAMTGEISLRGRVMPVGGIKEKLLAAHRAGIKHVLIPDRNRRDLDDVPEDVKDEVKITLVSTMEEILPLVLAPREVTPSRSPPPEAAEDAMAP
jgi:ATP-dependent Lon protease